MKPTGNPPTAVYYHTHLPSLVPACNVLAARSSYHLGAIVEQWEEKWIKRHEINLGLGGVAQCGLQRNQTRLYFWFGHFISPLNLRIFQVLSLLSALDKPQPTGLLELYVMYKKHLVQWSANIWSLMNDDYYSDHFGPRWYHPYLCNILFVCFDPAYVREYALQDREHQNSQYVAWQENCPYLSICCLISVWVLPS